MATLNTFTGQGTTKSPTVNSAEASSVKTFFADSGIKSSADAKSYIDKNFQGNQQAFLDSINKQNASNQAIAESAIATKTQEAQKSTEEAGMQIEKNYADNKAGIDETMKAEQKIVNEGATAEQNLIKEQSAKATEIEAQQRARLTAQQEQDIQLLKAKEANAKADADLERKRVEADAEYQRVQNENAIIQARADVEIEKTKSAWAYQKLGLGFSSGIINQSQQIATDGITKIAEIKAKMNYQEALVGIEGARIGTKLKDIELQYTALINQTIGQYSDKLDDLDANAIRRVQDVQKNLLMSNKEKDQRNIDILKEYRSETSKLEKEHIVDMMSIKDKGLEYTRQIQEEIRVNESIANTKLTNSISNGAWFNLSETQKASMLRSAGLTPADGRAMQDKVMNASIITKVQSFMPEGYVMDEATNTKVRASVGLMVSQGYTLEEATSYSVNKIITGTQEYKDLQTKKSQDKQINDLTFTNALNEAKNITPLEQKLKLIQLNGAMTPVQYSSGGGSSRTSGSKGGSKKTKAVKIKKEETWTKEQFDLLNKALPGSLSSENPAQFNGGYRSFTNDINVFKATGGEGASSGDWRNYLK